MDINELSEYSFFYPRRGETKFSYATRRRFQLKPLVRVSLILIIFSSFLFFVSRECQAGFVNSTLSYVVHSPYFSIYQTLRGILGGNGNSDFTKFLISIVSRLVIHKSGCYFTNCYLLLVKDLNCFNPFIPCGKYLFYSFSWCKIHNFEKSKVHFASLLI